MKLLALSTYCHLLYKTIILYTGNEMEGAIKTVSHKKLSSSLENIGSSAAPSWCTSSSCSGCKNNTRNEYNKA